VRNDHVEIYKVDNGAKTASFETGFARTLVGSLDQEGRLVLIGQGEDEAAGYSELKVFDPEGKLLWSMALQEREFKQPPVCGSDGMVYLINMNAVQAIRDSNVVWQNSTVNGAPLWLTAAGNGEVVAVESEGVTVFAADGSRRIDIPAGDVEDQFVTPAAIDSAGRILVAGEKALYCFD
jgi:outer membrane protein assembly factor BamB